MPLVSLPTPERHASAPAPSIGSKAGFISRFIAASGLSTAKHVKSRDLIHFYVVIKTGHGVARYEAYWPGWRTPVP